MIRRGLMMRHKSGRLPSGYTEVEYIENTSNAYINSKVLSNENLTFEVKTDNTYIHNSTYATILCARHKASATEMGGNQLMYNYANSSLQFTCGNLITTPPMQNGIKIFKSNLLGELFSDDVKIGKAEITPILNKYNIYLFATNTADTQIVFHAIGLRMYYCKLFINEVLVRDFVPCINLQNEVGMFDMVEQKFYKSPNGTPFIAGKPIEPPKPAQEYVKDGLVFWLDGRRQGGQPNKWIDLIQNIQFDLVDCVSNEDNVQFDGVKSYGVNGNTILNVDSYVGTIEVIYSTLMRTNYVIFANRANSITYGVVGNYIYYGNVAQKKGTWGYTYNENITASVSKKIGIVNKINMKVGANDFLAGAGNDAFIGCRQGTRNFFKGKIYSIRIYNRQLTEEEILHNQQLDIDNYFGGVIE